MPGNVPKRLSKRLALLLGLGRLRRDRVLPVPLARRDPTKGPTRAPKRAPIAGSFYCMRNAIAAKARGGGVIREGVW